METQTYHYLVYLEYNAETAFPRLIEEMKEQFYAALEAEGMTPCILEGSEEDEMLQTLRRKMEAIFQASSN